MASSTSTRTADIHQRDVDGDQHDAEPPSMLAGRAVEDGYPPRHRKTITLVAGLRMIGIAAPIVLNGPITGDRFEAYVGQVLVLDLGSDVVVIMDNLSSYKRARVRRATEAAGARFTFLPPTIRTSI